MIPYTQTKLPNGVRVILAPFNHTRAVTVLVLVGTGSKYEEKKINGVSHFLEHMFFKGTKKRPDKKEIAEILDAVGAEFNAFTSEETTGYYVKLESDHLPLALDVVADILVNSSFPQKEITLEKKVVVEEINMIKDTPMRQVYEYWERLLYGDQPAGRGVAGTPESVHSLTRKEILDYFMRQYRSENMVVCVAGNFNPAKTTKEIKKLFAGVRRGVAHEKPPIFEDQKKPQLFLASDGTGQTHILIGVRAFSMFDPKRYALMLLSTILGGGMSSRLFLSVREDKGLVYYIRTQSELASDSGYLVTEAGVDNSRVEEAITAIMKEYKSVRQKGVLAKELERAKSAMRGHMVIGLEESDDIAGYLAAQEILEKRIQDPDEVIAEIDKITLQEVNDVAKEIFVPEKLNLVVLGPHKNKSKFEKLLRDI